MTTITEMSPAEHTTTQFLWLDLTRKCQLKCAHCYNVSGPEGTHGTMTRENWISVLEQAAACGVSCVQFIGGEPTLHPDAAVLVDHALSVGLEVEVFSNLVHVTAEWWELYRREGVTLATSYYSDLAREHNAMTGRRSHGRTRPNIEKAVRLGVPLRVGIIVGNEAQRESETRRELEDLGVARIGVDHVRPFGRGAKDQAPDPANLCGQCGTSKAAIGPNGEVSPCIFSGWMSAGNIKHAPLVAILSSATMAQANASIRSAARRRTCVPDGPCEPDGGACAPDGGICRPVCAPAPCYPDTAPCQPRQNPPTPCKPSDPIPCSPDRG